MSFSPSSLETLCFKRPGKRMRQSSYDRSGGNDDRAHVKPGETFTFAEMKGAGMISHIWFTLGNETEGGSEPFNMRKCVLRCYWDGEENPSVLAPVGDFFGMGHGETHNFVSEPLQMSPQGGRGLNCWFTMPYGDGARLTLTNEGSTTLFFYYYVDYEECDSLPNDVLRFHAQWNRQCPTDGRVFNAENRDEWMPMVEEAAEKAGIDLAPYSIAARSNFANGALGSNNDGKGNYMILDAEGCGHYVGCNINIHNLNNTSMMDWPGEGDDMIFIDGEAWPPRLHGTGTEDYVNMAWCPNEEHNAPYHGIILGGKDNWKGKITYYRYHVRDPISFNSSIQVGIEHGHNNNRNDDWCTTAYWYQTEPHKPMSEILPVEQRMPVDPGMLMYDTLALIKP